MATKTKKPPAIVPDLAPLLVTALSRGLKTRDKLAAGKHRLRGRCTIDVDCFVEKGGPQQQKIPWPAAIVLTLALGKLVKDRAKLVELLAAAAGEALVTSAPNELDLGEAGVAMGAVRELFADKLPTVQKDGNTSVTGIVEVVLFEPAH